MDDITFKITTDDWSLITPQPYHKFLIENYDLHTGYTMSNDDYSLFISFVKDGKFYSKKIDGLKTADEIDAQYHYLIMSILTDQLGEL